MSGEIIRIDKDEIQYHKARVLARKRFVHNLDITVVRGSLSVDVYKYTSPGYLSDLIVVFKVDHSASYEIQSVIEVIFYTYQKAPIFLSRR